MKRLAILIVAVLPYVPIRAHALMAGDNSGRAVRHFPSEAAVLEVHEVKTSLPCAITPARTVTSLAIRTKPVYFEQKRRVPSIAEDGAGPSRLVRRSP